MKDSGAVGAMSRLLDKIYAEVDKEFRAAAVSQAEWEWLCSAHKPYTDRISELEWSLSFDMGRVKFADVLGKWQKNCKHVVGIVKARRVDPLAT